MHSFRNADFSGAFLGMSNAKCGKQIFVFNRSTNLEIAKVLGRVQCCEIAIYNLP